MTDGENTPSMVLERRRALMDAIWAISGHPQIIVSETLAQALDVAWTNYDDAVANQALFQVFGVDVARPAAPEVDG
jgi:hypothetical protein